MNDPNKKKTGNASSRKRPALLLARLAILLAAAMILSYVEHLIPAFVAIPGVKIGLANTVTVFALYLLGAPYAIGLSLGRVLLSSLLFGNAAALLYSLAGAAVSFLGMFLLRRIGRFSPLGVSVAGGVLHNLGQILAACLLFENGGLLSLLPPLILSGTIAGVLIGVLAGILIRRLEGLFVK